MFQVLRLFIGNIFCGDGYNYVNNNQITNVIFSMKEKYEYNNEISWLYLGTMKRFFLKIWGPVDKDTCYQVWQPELGS